MADAQVISVRSLLNNIFTANDPRKPDIEIKAINTGGGNYTSALFLVTVKQNEDTVKLFVKIACVNERLREAMKATVLYSTEQVVYTQLVSKFSDLEERSCVAVDERYKFPKFYGSSPNIGEETVVLEDLTANGYHEYSRFKSVDWSYAASAVKALAKFHALSFAYHKDNPEEFAALATKLKYTHTDNSDDENMMNLWKKILEGTLSVLDDEDHKEKMKRLLLNPNSKDVMIKIRNPIGVVVLAHGDYRTSNLLFKKTNDTIETIAVDYQTVHSGCPVTDLLYFIFLGTDADFRREHYDQLIDFYHTELSSALERLGIDVNDVYPREVYDKELKEMMSSALLIATVILPMVTVDAENAPQVGGDADINQFAVTTNELFRHRMNGLVSDCVSWGVV